MTGYRTIAIPTSAAEAVRATRTSPRYGHPAHVEVASGHGPCRHCLRAFRVGAERRILFTWDAFDGVDGLPAPGPVFVHEEPCERFPEDGGFPEDLLGRALVLVAYGPDRTFREELRTGPGAAETAARRLLARSDVSYVHVHDREAGCWDFRLERGPDLAPVAPAGGSHDA